MRGRAFEVRDSRELEDGVWLLSLRKGPWTTTLYVVAAGYEKRIEEELVKLTRLVYRRDVRQEGVWGRIKDLVKRASRRQLVNTLKICKALEGIEDLEDIRG